MAKHLTVFGATGGTGLSFVKQALAQGHSLHVLVRSKQKLLDRLTEEEGKSAKLFITEGDVLKKEDVAKVISKETQSVVLSLGRSYGDKSAGAPVCSTGTKLVLEVMKELGLPNSTRVICVSSWGVGDSKQDTTFLVKIFIWTILSKALADKEIQEEDIKKSGFEYVIARPAQLLDTPKVGTYRADDHISDGKNKISREDVAEFCLKSVSESTWVNRTPTLTY